MTRATCDSGTTVPWRVNRLTSFSVSRSRRSDGTARATMSIRSSCSRSWDSVAPFITVWVTRATSAGARPSARALSWSRSTLSVRTGSFQSSWTSRTFGLEATTRFDLARDLAHLLRVRTDDTELDREADRRTELQARDADPHLREFLVDARHQARAHAFTRLHVLRHHDEDGVARIRQLRIEREIEARLAGARCTR